MAATTPTPTLAGQEAWQCLHDIFFSDEVHERMHEACTSVGLTPPLMKALLSIDPDRPMPMKDLAGIWRCDASWVTSLCDGLEERGIVERRGNPSDRRSKLIALTPEGEATRDKLLDRLHEPPPFVGTLTAKEQRTLRDLLRKLVGAASANQNPPALVAEHKRV